MQEAHVTLPDFYLQWLMALSEVSKLTDNQFAKSLHESLMNRLTNLRNSRAFKMSLYLDPRLNFCGSRLFTAIDKDEIQVNHSFAAEKSIPHNLKFRIFVSRDTLLAYGKELIGIVPLHQ